MLQSLGALETARRPSLLTRDSKDLTVVNRRNLCSTLLLWGIVPSSQAQARPKLIGGLFPWGGAEDTASIVAPLRELGYESNRHFSFVPRSAEGRLERLPGIAKELVRFNVDLLIAATTNAAKAAQEATRTIPIVFYLVAEPVRSGFADSLAHPGHNMTGVSNVGTNLDPKRLDLLKQMVPGLERIAYLLNPASPFYPSAAQDYQALARKLGLRALMVNASNEAELEPAFREMVNFRAQALMVPGDAFLSSLSESIAALAVSHRLPSMWAFADSAELGGLMAYGSSDDGVARQVAGCVAKIFRGTRPEDIPIAEPMRFDFVINRKTADILRIKIPLALLLQATSVIE